MKICAAMPGIMDVFHDRCVSPFLVSLLGNSASLFSFPVLSSLLTKSRYFTILSQVFHHHHWFSSSSSANRFKFIMNALVISSSNPAFMEHGKEKRKPEDVIMGGRIAYIEGSAETYPRPDSEPRSSSVTPATHLERSQMIRRKPARSQYYSPCNYPSACLFNIKIILKRLTGTVI